MEEKYAEAYGDFDSAFETLTQKQKTEMKEKAIDALIQGFEEHGWDGMKWSSHEHQGGVYLGHKGHAIIAEILGVPFEWVAGNLDQSAPPHSSTMVADWLKEAEAKWKGKTASTPQEYVD